MNIVKFLEMLGILYAEKNNAKIKSIKITPVEKQKDAQ